MTKRAFPSGIHLNTDDAVLVKGMLKRGDRQHDIAAWFGVNGGRVAEIATERHFAAVVPAAEHLLPPPGPYPAGKVAVAAMTALAKAKEAVAVAEKLMTPTSFSTSA